MRARLSAVNSGERSRGTAAKKTKSLGYLGRMAGTALDKPHKSAHSGLGISAFGIALFAGAGLVVAVILLDPIVARLNQIFLGKVMVACGLLETIAITLAGAALTDTRHKTIFPIAAILLACGPLALVIAGLFGLAD